MGDQELKGRMFEELMGGNSMGSMRSSSDRMLDDDIGKNLPQNVKDAHHRAMIEFRRRGDVSVADYAKEDTWAGTAAKPYAKTLAAVYRKKLQLKDGEDCRLRKADWFDPKWWTTGCGGRIQKWWQ